MTKSVEVLLVGGTSHTGKSTLAAGVAERLGWQCMPTDSLARHPGRPWRPEGLDVPPDVIEHFLGATTAELVTDVTRHYERNVWPIAEAIVRTRLRNPWDRCLVLEGSAILPELVTRAGFERVATVWLTAPESLIVDRIRESSGYDARSEEERAPIDAFIERARAFGRDAVEAATRCDANVLDASMPGAIERLLGLAGA